MSDAFSDLPKRIWILWLQGMETAPYVVQNCIASWKERNPEWEIVLLHQGNLGEYIDLPLSPQTVESLSKNVLSDLIRLQLLIKYGGIWIDATVFCARPLQEWLPEQFTGGLFLFRDPGPDRMIASWFIAACPEHPVLECVRDELFHYFQEITFPPLTLPRKALFKGLHYLLQRNQQTARIWLHPFVHRVLRMYPYFVFHYTFAEVLRQEGSLQHLWSNTTYVSAEGPCLFAGSIMLSPPTPEQRHKVASGTIPVYKLTWKYDPARLTASSAVTYLFHDSPIALPSPAQKMLDSGS